MTTDTKIEWCDHTINFWWGCEKVTPACANCYAEGFAKRVGDDIWGKDKPRRWIKSAVRDALRLNKQAKREGVRYKVFTNSMADFFEEDHGQPIVDHIGDTVDWCDQCGCISSECKGEDQFDHGWRDATLTDFRRQAFETIDQTPFVDWLILTKRPENIRELIADSHQPTALSNVWLGTTVENQEQADKRIDELLNCRELSPVLFLSCEPLLGPLNLDNGLLPRLSDLKGMFGPDWKPDDAPNVDWIICGGESGHNARPMHPEWCRSLRDQCVAAGVPFFFKQWGEWGPVKVTSSDLEHCIFSDGRHVEFTREALVNEEKRSGIRHSTRLPHTIFRVGKQAAGRLLNGQEWSQFPE